MPSCTPSPSYTPSHSCTPSFTPSLTPSLTPSHTPSHTSSWDHSSCCAAGEGDDKDAPTNKGQLVQAEGRQSGTTPVKVYVHYAKAIGVCITTLIWLMLFAGQAVYLAADCE